MHGGVDLEKGTTVQLNQHMNTMSMVHVQP